ncbi:MAG: apolipoprotein N-acyltransferase [Spirochaetales bacterium]|nr:apolipoprotein N-acyltransferase [Spirochaetales bacterium]
MVKLNSNRSLRTVCSEVLTLLVSAFILSISFPGFISKNGIGFIALFAIIPVFMVIRNTTFKCVWFYGFLFGLCYYFFFNYWLSGFHPLAILIAPIIKGGEMLLLFLALKAAITFFPKRGYLLQGVIWVAYAYLAENWFAGYPYGNLGYALWQYRIMIQIADITGVWGIIFLMILPQAFVGNTLWKMMKRDEVTFKSEIKSNIIFVAIYAALVIASLIYGGIKLSYWNDREPDQTLRVAAVQHNHDSWKGGYSTYLKNYNNLKRETYESLVENPDLIIWSETAFVPSVSWHMNYYQEGSGWEDIANLTRDFVEFGKSLPVPLLTGNPKGIIDDETKPAYDEEGNQNRKDYNTVILFDDGEIIKEYEKQHLVPFTEHFPYEKQLPWLYNMLLANDYNWWEMGYEPVVFETDGVKFSTPICYEDSFGSIPAEFVANGAELIINMTNDNWSKKVSAEMQHALIATYRSVETRKATVRGTNSGITCMITPTGEMQDIMEPFTMNWHIYDVPVYYQENYENTFYVEHIDLFAFAAIYISIAVLALGAVLQIITYAKGRKK